MDIIPKPTVFEILIVDYIGGTPPKMWCYATIDQPFGVRETVWRTCARLIRTYPEARIRVESVGKYTYVYHYLDDSPLITMVYRT